MLQKVIKQPYFKSIITLILIIIYAPVLACDICGCFMGITPYDNQSRISLFHRYREFNGYRTYHQRSNLFTPGAYKVAHGTHEEPAGYTKTYSSKDYESYKIFELRLKYFIHKRIELNAIIPFNDNKSKQDTIINETYGIGDPSFFIGYHLVRRIDEVKFQHRLIIGAGFKLPSGNYYDKDVAGNRLPLLIQTGTGSVDYFAYVNHVFGYKKIGVSTNLMYKINGTNFYKEKIDNSFSGYLNLFYKVKVRNLIIIPSVQTYYEYTEGLRINGTLEKGTKMNSLLIGPGLDLTYKSFSLNMGYQFRAYEENYPENLQNAGRLMVGLSYNFNQRKYLLGNKQTK